jgi:hypothetical protein
MSQHSIEVIEEPWISGHKQEHDSSRLEQTAHIFKRKPVILNMFQYIQGEHQVVSLEMMPILNIKIWMHKIDFKNFSAWKFLS